MGLIPGRGTKIPHAARLLPKNKNKLEKKIHNFNYGIPNDAPVLNYP